MQVVDGQDMTAEVYVSGAFTSIVTDLILQGAILPRPQGVLFTYPEGGPLPNLPFLGFDRSDSQVAGLDQGHFT